MSSPASNLVNKVWNYCNLLPAEPAPEGRAANGDSLP